MFSFGSLCGWSRSMFIGSTDERFLTLISDLFMASRSFSDAVDKFKCVIYTIARHKMARGRVLLSTYCIINLHKLLYTCSSLPERRASSTDYWPFLRLNSRVLGLVRWASERSQNLLFCIKLRQKRRGSPNHYSAFLLPLLPLSSWDHVDMHMNIFRTIFLIYYTVLDGKK